MSNQVIIDEVTERHRGEVWDTLTHHPGWLPGETRYHLKRVNPTTCTLTLSTELFKNFGVTHEL